jgi:iron complex outermembrane recepter protein
MNELTRDRIDAIAPAWLSSIALAMTLAAPLALAQTASEEEGARREADSDLILEEITVTATKREQKLQDVPVAVSALTAEDITARGFSQYADYLNTVPGVYFEDLGPGRAQIRIRGLSTAEGGGTASTVATYFGETITSVVTLAGGKPNLRLVDIDRVEVLRGPQGTLFGANALAGVMRILPAAPDLQGFEVNLGTRGFTTAHSDDASFHVEGTVNFPLSEDRLALRLVGYKDEVAGYIDSVYAGRTQLDWTDLGEDFVALYNGQDPGTMNLPPGSLVLPGIPAFSRRDINSEDTWGARASLAWQANDQLRFDLMYAKQDSTLDSEPWTLPEAGPYAQSRDLDFFRRARYEESIEIASLTARYSWASVELISASSWLQYDRFDIQDSSRLAASVYGLPALPWSLETPSDSEQFTQEVRLQSTGSSPLQWTVGVFYLEQDSTTSQTSFDLSCPACLSSLLTGEEFTFRVFANDFLNEEQRAIFGELTYDLTPRWTVGIGARYFEGDLFAGGVLLEGFEAGGGAAIPSNSKESREFNPAAHVRFRPTEDLTLYLQAARGFRSASPNAALPDSCEQEAAEAGISSLTEPDTLTNYELGGKAVLAGGRANLNVAVYRADWKGVQIGAGLECGFGAIVNGGDAIGQGVEIELAAQLTRGWRFNLAAAYNHNEFDRAAPQTGFVKGERLPGSFEKNGSLGLQYDFVLGELWSGFARADYVHTGDVRVKFGRAESATFVTLDPQDIGNLRLGLQRRELGIEVYGRNLTDERGIASAGDPDQGGTQILIRPREIGIELRYSLR